MTDDLVCHASLTFERSCAAPLPSVFELYSNAKERERWSVPSDTATFSYEEADFRVGGWDVFRCGSKEAPQYRGETHYLDIVPDKRIVFSQVISQGKQHLCASMNTVRFEPQGEGTKITATVQLVSFVGDGMIEGTKLGMNAAFDKFMAAVQANLVD